MEISSESGRPDHHDCMYFTEWMDGWRDGGTDERINPLGALLPRQVRMRIWLPIQLMGMTSQKQIGGAALKKHIFWFCYVVFVFLNVLFSEPPNPRFYSSGWILGLSDFSCVDSRPILLVSVDVNHFSSIVVDFNWFIYLTTMTPFGILCCVFICLFAKENCPATVTTTSAPKS